MMHFQKDKNAKKNSFLPACLPWPIFKIPIRPFWPHLTFWGGITLFKVFIWAWYWNSFELLPSYQLPPLQSPFPLHYRNWIFSGVAVYINTHIYTYMSFFIPSITMTPPFMKFHEFFSWKAFKVVRNDEHEQCLGRGERSPQEFFLCLA